MSDNATTQRERFAESTNLKYGVVEDSIPEDDVYRHDENPVHITQFEEGGEYWLHVGSHVGLETTIMFDELEWHEGTLWFKRTVEGAEITTGNIEWHILDADHDLGLVGEWFLEQLDIDEYRTDHECPQCGETILEFNEVSGCESLDCDFFVEGRSVRA